LYQDAFEFEKALRAKIKQ